MRIIGVGIAEIKVVQPPALLRTNLGSCIAVCLYDPSTATGGLLHFMMPQAPQSSEVGKVAKYGDTGINELVEEVKRMAHVKTCGGFIAKIFGGARVLQNINSEIGSNNEEAARRILKELGIPITASQTGGDRGYKIEFDVGTGITRCQRFGEEAKEY
jgi:chemotaxis protein CheD